MDFPTFVLHVKDKNKTLFKSKEIKITTDNLEKILKYAYNEGFKEAESKKSVFEGIFGKL